MGEEGYARLARAMSRLQSHAMQTDRRRRGDGEGLSVARLFQCRRSRAGGGAAAAGSVSEARRPSHVASTFGLNRRARFLVQVQCNAVFFVVMAATTCGTAAL